MPSRAPRWRAATGKGPAARARRPGGQAHRALSQRDRTTGHERCARCQAAHCGGEPPRVIARRREPGGPAAKHRALSQRDRATGHGNGIGPRDTATGPDHGTEQSRMGGRRGGAGAAEICAGDFELFEQGRIRLLEKSLNRSGSSGNRRDCGSIPFERSLCEK